MSINLAQKWDETYELGSIDIVAGGGSDKCINQAWEGWGRLVVR